MTKHRRKSPRKFRIEPLMDNWTSPKKLKIELEDKLLAKRSAPRNYKRSNKTCKTNKGPHQFTQVSRTRYDFFDQTLIALRCPCGKKKLSFI